MCDLFAVFSKMVKGTVHIMAGKVHRKTEQHATTVFNINTDK